MYLEMNVFGDDFFGDMQFLSDAADDSPPVEFEQVTYNEIV